MDKDNNLRAGLFACLLILAGFVLLAMLQLKPAATDRDVAVVFSPSQSLTDIVRIISPLPFDFVRTGLTDFIVVVRLQEEADLSALKAVGALAIVSAYADGGCAFLSKKLKIRV